MSSIALPVDWSNYDCNTTGTRLKGSKNYGDSLDLLYHTIRTFSNLDVLQ